MKWVLGVMLEMLCVLLLVGFDVACFLQVTYFASGADGARWCPVVLAGAGGAPLCPVVPIEKLSDQGVSSFASFGTDNMKLFSLTIDLDDGILGSDDTKNVYFLRWRGKDVGG
ncbi:hypothetical protein Hanom_Chr16g01498741 [Helianthus anomalus]